MGSAGSSGRRGAYVAAHAGLLTDRGGFLNMTSAKHHSCSALVGVFDILGFRRIMSDTDLPSLSARLENLIQIAKGCGEQQSVFEIEECRSSEVPIVLQASDSFVVFSDIKSAADVVQFIWNIHHLVFHAISMGMPIRGAIAYGEALVQTDTVLFIGPAVIEAF